MNAPEHPSIPLEEQIAEVERDILERMDQYPKQIALKRLRVDHALERLARIRATLATLKALLKAVLEAREGEKHGEEESGIPGLSDAER